jgi:hypothetical protein
MAPEFFQTKMGRKYYERDIPTIAKSLSSIASSLEEKDKLKQRLFEVDKKDDGIHVGVNIDYDKKPLVTIEEDLEEKVINIYIWEDDKEDFTKIAKSPLL